MEIIKVMDKVLQFITNGSTVVQIVEQVKAVLEGGCKWIQIRMKNSTDDDIKKVLDQVKPMCNHHGAKLIMNDRVDIAKIFNLDGVHVGFEDMSVEEARNILGENAIIGVTANTIEEIFELSEKPMNYFGIGPMRFTETKRNLRPLIGLEGYHKIMCAMRETGITKPAVAVGGINISDVYDLLDAGLWGVAVSGAIANSSQIKDTTSQFMSIINKFNNAGN